MPNRLAAETSPYLRQHADNPVDWYPWGEEALERARREDRPILLSIGYSACHWCHVMAHESFEDRETAAVMNRLFVNIKVDREERPDLDHIYQTAHQMLAQRAGGWPLTMFLTPAGVPFYGGTYFPKVARYGLPDFVDLLERVSEAWHAQREAIEAQNESMLAALAQTLPEPASARGDFDAKPVDEALKLLEKQFDSQWGGFGGAPKFPHVPDLALLLASPESRHRDMVALTLRRMAEGGIFDQLGGGFFRYSVDAQWNIPHFEKMLCDNGLLLGLYADAWAVFREPLFKEVAEATGEWVLREMRAPGGGLYSALDADSEGEEGRFYVWDKAELQALLDDREFAVFSATYGLAGPPNFEGESWHLRVTARLPEADILGRARAKAFAARERRVRPGCDDKVLASWNGLMAAGLLRAGRRLGREDWVVAGQDTLDFVRRTLWRDGRLQATAKDGRAHLNAYLDDHAFLLAACLESLQARFRRADFDFAVTLGNALLERFEDKAAGAFYFTSHDHEQLVHRSKIGHDAATPAGNGVAALALQRLSALTGEMRYGQAAERTLAVYYPQLQAAPAGSASLLAALQEWVGQPLVIVVRGGQEQLEPWRRRLSGVFIPNATVLTLPGAMSDLPPTLDKPRAERVNAWVCEGVNCLPPIDDLDELLERFSR
ncbi:MAG TPA: thioredoxin domain-containing protein [Rhodocyclaceae bacterium]|nr:thioredoxin domain-containing protein [Rhodocyclaceae bacterium]